MIPGWIWRHRKFPPTNLLPHTQTCYRVMQCVVNIVRHPVAAAMRLTVKGKKFFFQGLSFSLSMGMGEFGTRRSPLVSHSISLGLDQVQHPPSELKSQVPVVRTSSTNPGGLRRSRLWSGNFELHNGSTLKENGDGWRMRMDAAVAIDEPALFLST